MTFQEISQDMNYQMSRLNLSKIFRKPEYLRIEKKPQLLVENKILDEMNSQPYSADPE